MKKTKKKYNNQTEEVNKALQKQNQHRRKISNLDDKAVEIIQRNKNKRKTVMKGFALIHPTLAPAQRIFALQKFLKTKRKEQKVY